MRLILASGSPRRRELLSRIAIPFDVQVADIDESVGDHDHARTYAQAMSSGKAREIARRMGGMPTGAHADDVLILAADTVVARQEHILGKPVDREDARRMLRVLSDGWHDVITGMTLLHPASGVERTEAEVTRVKFRLLDEALIERYLDTDEPFDKAGAYGVQGYGSLLVEGIEGDYYNVMGLPLHRLARMLEAFSCEPLSWLDRRGEGESAVT